MKYRIIATSRFEKDVKRCKKRNLPMEKLKKVIRLLEETGKLPPEYKPHKLSGQYAGSWECHIMSDWLLICNYSVKAVLCAEIKFRTFAP